MMIEVLNDRGGDRGDDKVLNDRGDDKGDDKVMIRY